MAVNPDDVRALFKGASDIERLLVEQDIAGFIKTGEVIVSEDLSGLGLSDDRLDQITKYLAAHFIILAVENGGLRRSRTGQQDESYLVPSSDRVGLASTRFGQQAIALDTTGTLAEQTVTAAGQRKAEFRVI